MLRYFIPPPPLRGYSSYIRRRIEWWVNCYIISFLFYLFFLLLLLREFPNIISVFETVPLNAMSVNFGRIFGRIFRCNYYVISVIRINFGRIMLNGHVSVSHA